MGTRTAVFSIQPDGTFEGIYVHFDGYVEGVGNTLEHFYATESRARELTATHTPLSSLGASPQCKEDNDENGFKLFYRSSDEKFTCSRFSDNGGAEEGSEYFKASTEQELRKLTYRTYDAKNQLQGWTNHKGEFEPWEGSDNNGYVYLWKNSKWHVSIDGEAFIPVADYLSEHVA